MALFHFTAKVLSRSTRNTVGAAAYRAGCVLHDIQTGEKFNYTNKQVQHVELLLPKDAPSWASTIQKAIHDDRQGGVQLWVNKVEAAEKRIDAQVWREIEFALHRELSSEQNIALAKEFAEDQLCSQGMSALLNFHFDVDEKTGKKKPHCHVLLTTRRLHEEGLSLHKAREWNTKTFLQDLRQHWQDYSNFHLRLLGHHVQIDHRSYYERGIEIEPQPKQGKNVLAQEQRLQKLEGSSTSFTDKGKAFHDASLRNLYRILRRPELVFDIVSKHHATFMWADVQGVLHRYIEDKQLFQRMEARLKNSSELVLLRLDNLQIRGSVEEQPIYTTRTLFKAEKILVEYAEGLDKTKSHGIEALHIETALQQANQELKSKGFSFGLSKDQIDAIQHFTNPGQLKCGVGIAGSGKTTALGICQEIWKSEGYTVYGLTPTGKAAQNLEQSGISSTTLHKFLTSFEEGRCQYNPKTILVLDEAGMVDMQRFSQLLNAVKQLGVKLVVVGDGAQLQPVEAGPAFRLITERIGKSQLTTVLRQEEDWQREATRLFGQQQTQAAIQEYHDKGCIHIVEESIPSLTHALASQDRDKLQTLYAIASRVSSRMYRDMAKDMEPYPAERRSPLIRQHPDHTAYLKWKSIEKATAPYLTQERQPHNPTIDLRQATKTELLKKWHTDFQERPENSSLILAFSNKDVDDLNTSARFLLKQSGHIEKAEILYKTIKEIEDDFGRVHSFAETKPFSKGDRIVFTRNNYGLNVKNGTLGTILELNKSLVRVKLDHEGREVSFAPTLNPFFDHGWATTIHKSQGTTVDKTYVLASYEMNQNLTDVAMTRHREGVRIFGSSLDFGRPERLPEILSTSGGKLASQDYVGSHSLAELIHPNDKLLAKLFTRLSDELEAMGAVSKKALWKVADHFLGINRDKESQKETLPTSIREETRAESLLAPKNKKGFWKDDSEESSFEIKAPIFQKPLDYEFSQKNLENIASFIEEKVHAINTYVGTRLARQAHEELQDYMKTLEKDKSMRQALKDHNQQLIKEAQRLLQEQERVINRSLDLSM